MDKNTTTFKKIIDKIITFLLIFGMLLSCTTPIFAISLESKRENVKVGFFAVEGYHVMDDNGVKSGYGYDFFEMIENFCGWQYEYVGYDKSWQDMLTMLDRGEIDILTFAQKTPEREEKYDYSDSPIGIGAIELTIKEGDNRFISGYYESYNQMRVGIEKGSAHESVLQVFAKENGFTYIPVYYDNKEQMLDDLQKGENVDGIITSSLRTINNEVILEELSKVEFYAIVKKGNTQLMDKINEAINWLDINDPAWRNKLKNEYFTNIDEYIVLDAGEYEYLQMLKNSNTKLKIVTNPDMAPYSYFEDGVPMGIAPAIFEEVANRLGLSYEYVQADTYDEYNSFVSEGKADIDITCFANYGLAEFYGMELSEPYMSTSLAMVSLETFKGDLKSIAKLKSVDNNTTYADELFSNVDLRIYDTHSECVSSVLRGDTDATYMYAYTAQMAVEQDIKNKLMYTVMPEYDVNMAIGVNEKFDYRMLSIINKGIRSVTGIYAQHVIQDELANITREYSVLSLIYDYPEVVLMIIVGIFGVIFAMCILGFMWEGKKKDLAQAGELSRFMGYVCEANDIVMEVNLDTLVCQTHNMENGVLVSHSMPYNFAQYRNDNEKIHPEDFDKITSDGEVKNFWNNLKKDGKGIYFEARAKDEEGNYCWYAYTIRPIPVDKNHPNNFIMFKKNINITKLKEEEHMHILQDALDTASKASSLKGQFLSKMSHEIRTPLNAVIGYMDIAKDSKDNPTKMLHCIENSDIAAKHLLNIINDVLDISSIESGKMKIAYEDFDLKKLITSVTTMFFNQAKQKNVGFDVKLNDITQEWVVGDSLRVNQILMNLLSNAVKFTPENGKIILSVTQLNVDNENVHMKFEVSDNGIGMSQEYQERLFSPFEQESAKTAQKYGGSGLGLSITNNLVNMMGGTIDVHSKIDEGTTFTVTLRFGKSNINGEEMSVPHDFSHLRALIVDDEKSSCEYMKNILKRCKVKSDIARDGNEAIRQIKRRMETQYAYDMCLIDWNMPDMNGIEVAKIIRKECSKDIPIIIATAYDITEFEDVAKEIGVDKIIAKPLFQSTMFDMLVSTYGKYEPEISKEAKLENLRGLNILLAEDNPMNLEIAEDILTKNGLFVDSVTDGQMAVDRFEEQPAGTYDVILMDIQMPVMDGYEATRKIRNSTREDGKMIPIIAMTANAFEEDVTAALACGMNGHVAKPINYDMLFDVLNSTQKNFTGHIKEE